MDKFDFEDFKSILSNLSAGGDRHARAIAKALPIYVDESEIIIFYPQNMYLDERYMNLFIFKKDDLLIISANREGTEAYIKKRRLSDIKDISLVHSFRDETATAVSITFSENEVYELMSFQDTNEFWKSRFKLKIIDIFRLLS